MKVIVPKSENESYKIMSDIMKGVYNTNELIEFFASSKTASLPRGVLRGYLKAICDGAVYKLDTKLFDKPIIDIVGTGGDGKRTANISTLSALICAATGLVYVAKYGNRSASGICGSMDLLEGLGLDIELSESQVVTQLKRFCFAPLYARAIYSGGKFVAEARKQSGGPTMFNLLFPLARPISGDQNFVFGCATQNQMDVVEKIYAKEKNIRSLLVQGLDQTDEISTSESGKTRYRLINQGEVERGVLNSRELGIAPLDLRLLQVGTKDEAVEVFKEVLDPNKKGKKVEAIRNAGIVNAAVALFIALEDQTDITRAKKYLSIVQETLLSGKVLKLVIDLKLLKG